MLKDSAFIKKFILTSISILFFFGTSTIIYDIFLLIPYTEYFRYPWKSSYIFTFFIIIFSSSIFKNINSNNNKKLLNVFVFLIFFGYFIFKDNNLNNLSFFICLETCQSLSNNTSFPKDKFLITGAYNVP